VSLQVILHFIASYPSAHTHCQKLGQDLSNSYQRAKSQPNCQEGEYILKLKYSGSLEFKDLEQHGVKFISHEDKEVCIVFSNDDGIAKFSDHLQRITLDDSDNTYKRIIEAIDETENWTVEDRKSWAIQNKGLPY
jgi:hypothetical protein